MTAADHLYLDCPDPCDCAELLRRPMYACGYIDQRDGCCTHPLNPTPECHSDVTCPVLSLRTGGNR